MRRFAAVDYVSETPADANLRTAVQYDEQAQSYAMLAEMALAEGQVAAADRYTNLARRYDRFRDLMMEAAEMAEAENLSVAGYSPRGRVAPNGNGFAGRPEIPLPPKVALAERILGLERYEAEMRDRAAAARARGDELVAIDREYERALAAQMTGELVQLFERSYGPWNPAPFRLAGLYR